MIWAWIETSSALIGSSATIEVRVERQRASDADALPLAAGELVRVARAEVRVEADRPSSSRTRSRRSAFEPTLWISSGSPMIPSTFIRGFRLAYGSWKIICIRRRMLPERARPRARDVGPVELIVPAVGR